MRALVLLVTFASVALAAPGPRPQLDLHAVPGWGNYERYCLPCHGANGDGRGPAAPFTRGRPRSFVRGEYEWRSMPLGQPPSADDLRATIRFGARGTSMPGFDGVLSSGDVDDLIAILREFDPEGFPLPIKPVVLGPPRAPDLARGEYQWTQLACDRCHGARGHGDGPSGKALPEPPYDLTAVPLHRPRETDDLASRRRAAALSIATGLAGTAMPGYAGQIADADVWALADRVIDLGASARPAGFAVLDPRAIAADAAHPIATGTWPGPADDPGARVFGTAIAAQGPAPASLAPAEASLSARQCGRCHAKQVREWQPSLHAGALSPGVRAQTDFGMPAEQAARCQRCHAPLAEQRPGEPAFDAQLRAEGATCAGCHVRGWTRLGPPRVDGSLLPAPGYPREELAIYERADFCLPCHQLTPRDAVAGKPLLDTYAEWLEGPYMRRGIQCEHCHMPNREHQWLGVHDRTTFRQGVRLDASAHRANGAVTVVAALRNIGAGHDLPTTATPAVWLRIALYDAHGRAIAGASDALRIGRDVYFDGTWHERADTRIPPGEAATMARAWTGGRTAEAALARVTVEVHPDAYYEGFYAQALAGKLAPGARALYEQALARAKASPYIADQRDVEIALSSGR